MNIKKTLVLLAAFGCTGTLLVTSLAQQDAPKVTVSFDANWRSALEPLIAEFNKIGRAHV